MGEADANFSVLISVLLIGSFIGPTNRSCKNRAKSRSCSVGFPLFRETKKPLPFGGRRERKPRPGRGAPGQGSVRLGSVLDALAAQDHGQAAQGEQGAERDDRAGLGDRAARNQVERGAGPRVCRGVTRNIERGR